MTSPSVARTTPSPSPAWFARSTPAHPSAGARILAGGSNPLNGRTSGRGDWLGQVRTGSDGTYTAIVAATGVGTFVNMTASASGYTFLPDEGIPVHAQAGTSHSVDFTGHSRGKVVGRVVAPGGGNASGIKVTVYEGTGIVTNTAGDTTDTLDDMTTTSTGTFSLDVGAYGSFFIEAEVNVRHQPHNGRRDRFVPSGGIQLVRLPKWWSGGHRHQRRAARAVRRHPDAERPAPDHGCSAAEGLGLRQYAT